MCILISCSSVLCVLMSLGMFMFVKVMSSVICVMSHPPCLCVWWCSGGIFGVLAFCASLVSYIVMMTGWVLCTTFLRSSILFLMEFMLI